MEDPGIDEVIIKTDVQALEGGNLVHGKDKAVVIAVMNIRDSHNKDSFLTSSGTTSFSRG